MSIEQLKRLEAGIKAAHAAGNAEHVKKLGAAYRQLQSQIQTQPSGEVNSGIGSALDEGWDQAGLAIGKGAEGLGEYLGIDWLRRGGANQVAANEAEIAQRNYQRPEGADGIFKNLMEGDFLDAGKSLVYGAAENVAPVGAGAAASLGAAAALAASGPAAIAGGGVAAVGTGIGVLESLGSSRLEKEQKGLSSETNLQDIGTAIASGLVELVPAGKGAGFVLSFTKEGLQEAAQEGLVIGNTALQGGEYVPEEVVNRLVDAGIIGGTVSKGVQAGIDAAGGALGAGADALDRSKELLSTTDNREFSDDERRAALRLQESANYDEDVLGNVDDVEDGTAKGAANAALREVRAEADITAQSLQRLAQAEKNVAGLTALKTITKQIGNQKTPTPQSHIDKLLDSFGNHPDAQRLASLARQATAIQNFTADGTRDMGGFSQFTRRLDITDKRNNLGLVTGFAVGTGNIASLGMGQVINRTAKWLDRKTNRRSRVKRFVDSALRDGETPADIQGPTALDTLEELKQKRIAEKAAERLKIEIEKQKAKGQVPGQPVSIPGQPQGMGQATQQPQVRMSKEEQKAAQEAERRGYLSSLNREAVSNVFATGQIPENDPFFNTYRYMREQTGLSPEDALAAIEQLEREGMAPPGTAQRFAEDPLSFGDDTEATMSLQRAVRARANPDFVPAKPQETSKKIDPEVVRNKFQNMARGAKDRRDFKRIQGQNASIDVADAIREAGTNLSADQYEGLLTLKEAMDTPGATREARFKMLRDTLPILFDNPAQQEFWRFKFAPLAAIGNDYAIERSEQEVQEQKEERFEKLVQKAAQRKKKAQKSAKQTPSSTPVNRPVAPTRPNVSEPANVNAAPDQGSRSPQTTADRALAKLRAKEQQALPAPDQVLLLPPPPAANAVEKARAATEPKVGRKAPEARGRNSIADMVYDRVEGLKNALIIAELHQEELDQYVRNLPPTVDGRVEGLIYEFANDRVTVNMLAEGFSSRYGVPVESAVVMVNDALARMESAGRIKRYVSRQNNTVKFDGNVIRGDDGKPLRTINLEILDEGMQRNLEIAKAVQTSYRLVNQDSPDVEFAPGRLSEGPFRAFKDIPDDRVDSSFAPILNALNWLRKSKLSVNEGLLSQIEAALEKSKGDRRAGTIRDVLLKKTDDGEDHSPLRAVAHLIFQLSRELGAIGAYLIRQEWKAGANLRIYSINGPAHSQGGDLMKGILRMPEKKPVGDSRGLDFIFHSIGNLLGYDKEAPAVRRQSLFQQKGGKGATIADELYRFAGDPFGRTMLKTSGGEMTPLGKIISDGEGFFQVLNAAHEVKNMVDFAKARFPKKSRMKPGQLLQDPEVLSDLAQNYSTDFIVQLDASNNAYQIAGMVMGYEDVLRATGFLPQIGAEGDPDGIKGADIYMEPARAIAQRIPELVALDLPDSKLRKLFKGPIGTYLYAAEFNSRKDAFLDKLQEFAGDADIFYTEGGKGLIPVPKEFIDAIKSEQGVTLNPPRYDVEGNMKKTKPKRVRVVPSGDSFVLEVDGKNRFTKFETEEEAITSVYGSDFLLRMNHELIRDMNTRYPWMRAYLSFAQAVSDVAKARGLESINVPTKDGMMLEYSFKQNPKFARVDVTMPNGNVVPIGVQTPDYALAGRGLAAFMTHQNDAYVLRETMKRMQENGGLSGFSPIHDSYGFYPSEASRGQETFIKVMQELGQPDYNIFLDILRANQIEPQEMLGAIKDQRVRQMVFDMVFGRKSVPQVDPRQIPTALS